MTNPPQVQSSLSAQLLEAMNEQIRNEFGSAYTYLAMAAYCETENLPGFARWLEVQAEEEVEHAMKFYRFINDRNDRVRLLPIEQPPVEFDTPLDVFQKAYANERKVTAQINRLYGMAVEEGDYASQAFLDWFVSEQVEEEQITAQVLETLQMIGDGGQALYLLDRELGAREEDED